MKEPSMDRRSRRCCNASPNKKPGAGRNEKINCSIKNEKMFGSVNW